MTDKPEQEQDIQAAIGEIATIRKWLAEHPARFMLAFFETAAFFNMLSASERLELDRSVKAAATTTETTKVVYSAFGRIARRFEGEANADLNVLAHQHQKSL